MTDPQPDFRPTPGLAETVGPGIRRILAPNPSPMTFRGTNTYLVGTGEVAVIDPGPDDPAHLAAILAALEPGERVTHVLVTHAHLDHSPLARHLSDRTGAPVLAFGPAEAGRSPVMARLAAEGLVGGGEGVDRAFAPDILLADGARVEGEGWRLEALHLPGHMASHMGFALDGALFSGDLVMGWATSLVSPPDGDLGAFMASLDRLAGRRWTVFHPGHGAPVADPAGRVEELSAHRRGRARQIAEALADGPSDPAALAARIYTDVSPALLPAAERNVLAHLIEMVEKGSAQTEGPLHRGALFSLT
ncbi:MBL fold metallo-hydrolase [Thetidibacter halocola]|uniref:MBL fold metallo-hydrolase n=1 Tax=Thetidibacter halocola TaxID=2827239 RepID=A0A8J7WCA4_9RHOB|nr:MBL fold metallo-hydrolase [Thetidibacter halocola]